MERQARRKKLSSLTSGWCEGEDGELQTLSGEYHHAPDHWLLCLLPFFCHSEFIMALVGYPIPAQCDRRPQDAWSISWCQHHGEGSDGPEVGMGTMRGEPPVRLKALSSVGFERLGLVSI